MKKIFVIALLLIGLGSVYFWQGNGSNLMSSVMIGNNTFPDGTPKTTEEAFIKTIQGVSISGANFKKNIYNGYYAPLEGNGWAYGVRIGLIRLVDRSVFENYIRNGKFAILAQYNGSDVFVLYDESSGNIKTITWLSVIGNVEIFHYNRLGKNTPPIADWNKVHNTILNIVDEYIKKYPAIPASEYSKFGPYAANIMKNFDLTKLPQLSQK